MDAQRNDPTPRTGVTVPPSLPSAEGVSSRNAQLSIHPARALPGEPRITAPSTPWQRQASVLNRLRSQIPHLRNHGVLDLDQAESQKIVDRNLRLGAKTITHLRAEDLYLGFEEHARAAKVESIRTNSRSTPESISVSAFAAQRISPSSPMLKRTSSEAVSMVLSPDGRGGLQDAHRRRFIPIDKLDMGLHATTAPIVVIEMDSDVFRRLAVSGSEVRERGTDKAYTIVGKDSSSLERSGLIDGDRRRLAAFGVVDPRTKEGA